MAKQAAGELFQVKVTLAGVRPAVWRRLLVSSDDSLRRFHDILQVALGWTDSHLHMFDFGTERYGYPDPDGDIDWIKDDARVQLGSMLVAVKDSLIYDYDFGDSWSHKIVLEQIVAEPGELVAPTCLGGARACPPEDCGGVGGYVEFLRAINDPLHPEHAELVEWIGGEFDPEQFDAEAVNLELLKLPRGR